MKPVIYKEGGWYWCRTYIVGCGLTMREAYNHWKLCCRLEGVKV